MADCDHHKFTTEHNYFWSLFFNSFKGQYALGEAIRYYECYLAIVKAMDNRILMGRAYGNLGNAHYRLGSFETAIECHRERLKLAEEHNDRNVETRPYDSYNMTRLNSEKFQQYFTISRNSA